jgi:hypothetical protein
MPLHPSDVQRLLVPCDGGYVLVERVFCEPCATALRGKPIAPLGDGRARRTVEPDWYRLVLTV